MRKIFLVVLALFLFQSFVLSNDWYYEKYWTGCGYGYRKVYYQPYVAPVYTPPAQIIKKETQTTVVNNLIGIPVPVNYTQPIAQQGTTVYGYSTVAEAYGNVDLGLLYNQAARLTDQAQQLAGQAATDFQSLVQAEGQNRAEVAKIIAQGQAARDVLLAAKGPPTANLQKSFSFKVYQDSKGEMRIEKTESQTPNFDLSSQGGVRQDLKDPQAFSTLLRNQCVSCHNTEKASGGLNFLGSITDAQQAACLERIINDDQSKRMPKGKPRMSVAEIGAFFHNMGPQTQK